MSNLLLLCFEFFKTGLLAVGGGLATIPFLNSMAQRYPQWMSVEELTNMIAVGESTPGPIGVNMATYVGYNVAGIPGALLATFSLVLPSLVLLMLIAHALQRWSNSPIVKAAFSGLRPAVTGLIAAAGYSVLQISLFINGAFSPLLLVMFLVLLCCTQIKVLKKLHPVVYIAVAAGIGMALGL